MKQAFLCFLGLVVTCVIFLTSIPATAAWNQTIGSEGRFEVLANMNDEAVLDKETGIVWERVPSSSMYSWSGAQFGCISKWLGGRYGWRLPSIYELMSLVDATQSMPALPAGHPFGNISPVFFYWSGTSFADSSMAWTTEFGYGSASLSQKEQSHRIWCVRGGVAQ